MSSRRRTPPDTVRLRSKRVVVTGASSGIGLAAARRFAREGADLALIARGSQGLERAAEAVRGEADGARRTTVATFRADVADRAQLEVAVEAAAERLGGIDVLVPNAAAAGFGPFAEMGADDFDRSVAITFTGVTNTVRAALPHLRRSAGTIIVTGSIVATVPTPLFTPYVASKAALRAFAAALSAELRDDGRGVTVSVVHPGVVDTPFWPNSTSATGRRPRLPPLAYDADTVARAIVERAVEPRLQTTVGLLASAQSFAYALGGPVARGALRLVGAWLRGGDGPAAKPGSLWQPSGSGRERGNGDGGPGLSTLVAAPLEGAGRMLRRVSRL